MGWGSTSEDLRVFGVGGLEEWEENEGRRKPQKGRESGRGRQRKRKRMSPRCFVPDFASSFVLDIVPEIPEAASCRYRRLLLPRYQVHFGAQVEAEEMHAANGARKACRSTSPLQEDSRIQPSRSDDYVTREDSDSRAKEKLLGYLKCLDHAISKYVQHVPTTLHAFLQLPVLRSEGNSELKSSHSQFIGLFRRAVGVPKGTLIRNAARDLYKGGGSNPVQWMRATICTLVFEFSIDSGSLFDDPEILEKLLATHMDRTLAESIIMDARVQTWVEQPLIFVKRRNALYKARMDGLRAVMSTVVGNAKTQPQTEMEIVEIAAKLHVAILALREKIEVIKPEIGEPFYAKYHMTHNSFQLGQSILLNTMIGIKYNGINGWEVLSPAVVLLTGTAPVSSGSLNSNVGANFTAQGNENSPPTTRLPIGDKAIEPVSSEEDIRLAMDDEAGNDWAIQDESDSNIGNNSAVDVTAESDGDETTQAPAATTAKSNGNETTQGPAATDKGTPEPIHDTALRRSRRNDSTMKRKIDDEQTLQKRPRQKNVPAKDHDISAVLPSGALVPLEDARLRIAAAEASKSSATALAKIRNEVLFDVPPDFQGLSHPKILPFSPNQPDWDELEIVDTCPENGYTVGQNVRVRVPDGPPRGKIIQIRTESGKCTQVLIAKIWERPRILRDIQGLDLIAFRKKLNALWPVKGCSFEYVLGTEYKVISCNHIEAEEDMSLSPDLIYHRPYDSEDTDICLRSELKDHFSPGGVFSWITTRWEEKSPEEEVVAGRSRRKEIQARRNQRNRLRRSWGQNKSKRSRLLTYAW
ncbi:hypothetical protein V502_07975 [Pseudogymnoascus sp. VKM F-4520 (FW-2644)]|nr:hypothetical protein V502_07975 [Pseudogymnoascus sp. VKM F-4520 (FW-2644)]